MGGTYTEHLVFKSQYTEVFLTLPQWQFKSNFKSNKIGPKSLGIQAALNAALKPISTDDPISSLKCKSQIQSHTGNSVPLSRNIQNVKVARYGESLFCPWGTWHSDPPAQRDLMLWSPDSCPYQERWGSKPVSSGSASFCLVPHSVLSDCSSRGRAGIINILPLWGVMLEQQQKGKRYSTINEQIRLQN